MLDRLRDRQLARTVTSFNVVQQLVAFPMLFLGGSYFPSTLAGLRP
jgi:hypothetical protein